MARNESKNAGHLGKPPSAAASSIPAVNPTTVSEGGLADTVVRRGSGPTELPPQFGRYRVIKKLGGGGMGTVYLVENTELEREEALKVPHFNDGDDREVRERFLREAKSAAKLDHANICPVYDTGVQDGTYYLTMRFLKGKPLSDYISIAQPARKVVEIVTKLAQALESAHAKGVVHRDLKPGNIMMVGGAVPVVMDFGLAKLIRQTNDKLTQDGSMLGTPAYMPPEQLQGQLEQMGPASDIFSLGVILYELLTGRLPFTGPTTAIIFGQILHTEPPPPSTLVPGLNSALDGICRKAMAKNPAARYPSMKAFAATLLDYLRSTPATEGAGNLAPTAVDKAAIFQKPTVAPSPQPAGKSAIFQAATVAPGSRPASDSEAFAVPLVAPPARRSLPPTQLKPASVRSRKDSRKTSNTSRTTNDEGQSQRHRLIGFAVGAAFVLLTIVISGLWAAGVFRVRTTEGTLVVEVNEPNPEVYVDGEKVTVTWKSEGLKAEIGVKPGTRDVVVKKDGFRVYGKEVTLEKGGREVLVATLEPNPAPPPPVPPIPPVDPNPSPFQTISGNWRVSDDELWQTDQLTPFPRVVFGDLGWTDYDFTVDAMRVEGKDQFALLFRTTEAKDYSFTVAAWGTKCLAQIHDQGQDVHLQTCEFKGLQNNKWCTALVRVRGSRYECILDGVKIFESQDHRIPNGRVGLRTCESSYRFRNIIVTSPDGTVLWQGLPPKKPNEDLEPPHNPVAGVPPKRLDCTGENGVDAALVRPTQEAWAKFLGRKVEEQVELGAGITMHFVLVPPGQFRMGSPLHELGKGGRYHNETLHDVILTEPFYVSKFEVTQAQYRAVTGQTPSFYTGDDRPVEQVTWTDADAFGRQLTQKLSDGCLYRLATEAEWEYSCRAGRPVSLPFGVGDGRILTIQDANFDNSVNATSKVGSYPPNALGLCDMHGNVWEWCADWNEPYPNGPARNPLRATGGQLRVARGGCHNEPAPECRAALRQGSPPDRRDCWMGFRVSRAIPVVQKIEDDGEIESPPKFGSLFDGETLKGWKGDPRYWSVSQGAIVGKAPAGLQEATFLTHENEYDDFELRLKFRVVEGNSGVQFRSQQFPGHVMRGPQADLFGDWWGSLFLMVMDNQERLAFSEEISAGTRDRLKKLVGPNDWIDLKILAQGSTVRINVAGSDTINTTKPSIARSGLIGFELFSGGTTVMFKDIEIQPAPTAKEPSLGIENVGENPNLVGVSSVVPDGPLSRSIDVYRKQVDRANAELLSQFQETTKSLLRVSSKKSVDVLHWNDVLAAERKAFETQKRLPWSGPMRPHTAKFLNTLERAATQLQKDLLIATEKQGSENGVNGNQLRSQVIQLLAPHVVGSWGHQVGRGSIDELRLLSNGRIGEPESEHRWLLDEKGRLLLFWRNPSAPKGAWIDTCELSSDGKSYSGGNNNGMSITGHPAKD